MENIIKLLSEKRTFQLLLFTGAWTAMLAMAIGPSYMGLNVCMAVFVCLMVLSGILCLKAEGIVKFLGVGQRSFTLFDSVSVLLWFWALIALGHNDEMREIVANVSVCVLVIGLALIALFPNKRVLPE